MTKTDNAFRAITHTAENHFWLLSHAAVFRLVNYLRRISTLSEEPPDACLDAFPFLSDYFEGLRPYLPEDLDWNSSGAWWEDQIARWEAGSSSRTFLPFRRLAVCSSLTLDDRLGLLLIGLVEDDIRFGSLFA